MFLGRLDGRHLGQIDEALAILREHAPEGLDAGFEHNPVASDSLRYVLERSPAECADALPPPSPRHHGHTYGIRSLVGGHRGVCSEFAFARASGRGAAGVP